MTIELDAITMGDMPFYGDTRETKAVPERYCSCGTKLARYNGADRCFPCQERARDRALEAGLLPLTAPRPRPTRYDMTTRDAEFQEVLAYLQAHRGPHLVYDIAKALNIPHGSVGAYLWRSEHSGVVRRAGKRSVPGHGNVVLWEAA